jgi:uncharacterized membrane protein SirB2
MDQLLLPLHKFSVQALLLIYLIKTILLLMNKKDNLIGFTKMVKVPEMIVSTLFLITGIWMFAQIGAIKTFQIIKLVAVFIAIPLAVIGFKKSNKALALLSLISLIAAYGLAEMSKKQPYPIAKVEPVEELSQSNKGQLIYQQNCIRCHGDDGKMGILGAKDLTTSAMNHEGIIGIISNGKSAMPAYSKSLSAEDIELVAVYVEQLRQ